MSDIVISLVYPIDPYSIPYSVLQYSPGAPMRVESEFVLKLRWFLVGLPWSYSWGSAIFKAPGSQGL